MAERVYSVSDLIRQINLDLFRYHDIAVEGELTNYVKSSAGHHYFTIKDARASLRVVASESRRLPICAAGPKGRG